MLMLEDIISAVALMLVLEGIMPFVIPSRWRSMVGIMATMPDQNMRVVGLLSMLTGLCLLILSQ
jgi:hypothetical protein